MSMNDELLTTLEAAERIGVSRARVLQLIAEGQLPARRLGSQWVVRAQDVDAFERQPVGYPKGRPRTEGGDSGK